MEEKMIIYVSLAVIGTIVLLLYTAFSEVSETLTDSLEGVDNFLEGFGIDIIPDEMYIGSPTKPKGVGCSAILSFITMFGYFGWLSRANSLTPALSFIIAVTTGIIVTIPVVMFINWLYKQQYTTTISGKDLVDAEGIVTITVNKGIKSVGQGAFIIRGQRQIYSITEIGGKEILKGRKIKVQNQKGGTLIVKEIN